MHMAASSSAAAITPQEKYDVFLSFRGADTRKTFTSHLHAALDGKKIQTYIDNILERGDKIGPALLKAIDKSKISLIIFSKNYASSTWCLDELVHILECKERYGQIVIPIFYGVDPSHVRKQQGSYADAFVQHEERFKDSMDKVLKWRVALKEAADMSGFDNSNYTGTEANFVEEVVYDVLTKLNRKSSSDLTGLVGIESQIKQIESLLCTDSPDVVTVGIWGMGGIGKTTLADAVFHQLSSNFKGSCFLKNVRENSEQKDGIYELRNVLLREILKDKDINIKTPSIGSISVRERLGRTKSLIVLDDVNDSRQLKLLVGDPIWFGRGSRIIVTTRDRGLLKGNTDDGNIYEVKGLKSDEALQLFRSLAFKNKSPNIDCTELSIKVVEHVKGLPLALTILGPLFHSCSTTEDWEEELEILKKFPNGEIQHVLRHSYDVLTKNEKEIFLDIACFYNGENIDFVKRRVDIHGFGADVGIRKLIDKSLISIGNSLWAKKDVYEMHDLVQEMGWEIVQEQCIEEPGQRDRLFLAKDVYHVLSNNTGTAKVQCISLNLHSIKGVLNISGEAFQKMHNLRLLRIRSVFPLDGSVTFGDHHQALQSLPNSLRCIDWDRYPLESLPSKFSTENLVGLNMPDSKVVALLWNKDQNLGNLKWIDLSYSEDLTEVAGLSQCPKLEHVDLSGCSNLQYLAEMTGNIKFLNLSDTAIKQLPPSVWSMEKLRFLDITSCTALEILPSGSCKLKLDHFDYSGCFSLRKFWNLPIYYTTKLDLSGTAIEVLPSSIECLSALVAIQLTDCKKLSSLEFSICKLKSLQTLDMRGCSQFEYFPEILEPMEQLHCLDLSGTSIKQLPSSICKLKSLRTLDMRGCSQFEYFPEILEPMEQLWFLYLSGTAIKQLPSSICKLKSLHTLHMRGCSQFEYFPEILEPMEKLQFLDLSGTTIKQLPASSIGNVIGLRELHLNLCLIENIPASIKQAGLRLLSLISCKSLQSLPELPAICSVLAHGCTSLKTLSSSRTLQERLDEGENVERLGQQLVFSNCENLDENSRRNIMEEAQLRIMEAATATARRNIRLEAQLKFTKRYKKGECVSSTFSIACPGKEIPNWFSYQNEGCSMNNIKLTPDWFSGDFLGFALSVVFAGNPHKDDSDSDSDSSINWLCDFGCRFSLKTNKGEIHEFNFRLKNWIHKEVSDSVSGFGYEIDSDHVVMWYNSLLFDNVAPAEASVHFYLWNGVKRIEEVKKCGLCLVKARGAGNQKRTKRLKLRDVGLSLKQKQVETAQTRR